MMLESVDKYHWVGTIETYSGTAVDVINLTPEMVNITDIGRSLSNICRYNGHIPSFYSVAEHSVRCGWWVRIEGGSILEQKAALMHDAAEAYVGDMVRPLKRHAVGKTHQELEDAVTKVIAEKFGLPYPLPDICHEADKATYYWEVENIRSGRRKGWSPDDSYSSFMARFNFLDMDLDHG